jgi:hypothetical protein
MKSLPLLVLPTGVITPTTHHRLPSGKPSRRIISVQQLCFPPCLIGDLSVPISEVVLMQDASKAETTRDWLCAMGV